MECIGCGFCCLKAPCEAARRVYGAGVTLCPALKWDGSRHVCSLMLLPNPLGEQFKFELGAGAGCCCGLNSWRHEPLQNRLELKKDCISQIPSMFQIFLYCLGREFISGDLIFCVLQAFRNELLKRGEPELYVNTIVLQIKHYLTNARTQNIDDFMGRML